MKTTFQVEYWRTGKDVKREISHVFTETWEWRTDLFCISCARNSVWGGSGDDYYQGRQHICRSCGATWMLPSDPFPVGHIGDDPNVQRLKRLREV